MTYGAGFLEGALRLAWVEAPMLNCQLDTRLIDGQEGDGRSGCMEKPCFIRPAFDVRRFGPGQRQLNGSQL
jgi:hypothetical protein